MYDNAITKNLNSATPEHAFRYSGIARCDPETIPRNNCGSTSRKLGAVCGECEALPPKADRFIKWVGKVELTKIQNQGRQL